MAVQIRLGPFVVVMHAACEKMECGVTLVMDTWENGLQARHAISCSHSSTSF